jgi:hypothetical protein
LKEGYPILVGPGLSSGRLRGRTDAPQGAQKLLRVSTRRSGDFLGDLPRLNKLGDGGDKVSRAPLVRASDRIRKIRQLSVGNVLPHRADIRKIFDR